MAKTAHFSISVPEPCHVPWETMSPVDDLRRHCASCEKVIVDFSQMSDDELILHFRNFKGKGCGRFSLHQLNRPLSRMPERNVKARWWRVLLLFPLLLFGKQARAQFYKIMYPPNVDTAETMAVVAGDTLRESDPDSLTEAIAAEEIKDTLPGSEPENDTLPSPEIVVTVPPVVNLQGISIISESYIMGVTFLPSPPEFNPFEWAHPVPDKPGKQQLSDVPNPDDYNSSSGEKPLPPSPATPGSNELSGILPEKRRRPWRS